MCQIFPGHVRSLVPPCHEAGPYIGATAETHDVIAVDALAAFPGKLATAAAL